jgi:hypothetical protein
MTTLNRDCVNCGDPLKVPFEDLLKLERPVRVLVDDGVVKDHKSSDEEPDDEADYFCGLCLEAFNA